ncbi:N-terminal domain of NEFA-interacting nuclear protein NIP30-domain-containing protein [Calycina marina]|uniref:N-terminal domain of NEFA-interacting nuclear protein NIP30-domain-containing protein n=1 Tax=Calycina marina TaxID=1763456 RepID=A0A9P7YWR6_9HELO|nr:N-terminal domain of NEFA-interacting nuclear protein NIP30-domain-containing protein [Calycina marina]
MSSGFVSSGTLDAPIERDDAWLAAQKEIELKRAAKAAAAVPGNQRSLFETLEANKAAKQDAFEEANKIKNQFRTLDADEIEFLDEVLESTRKEEARVKKETQESLIAFRKRQEEVDKRARDEEGAEGWEGGDDWAAAMGRKRKREKKEGLVKGVKVRRASTLEEKIVKPAADETKAAPVAKTAEKAEMAEYVKTSRAEVPAAVPKAASSVPPPKSGMSLVDYGSDDDDW